MTIPDTTTTFVALRFVEAVFGSLGSESGASAEEILTAERRLGVKLPEGLRELYQRTGRVAALHTAHNKLVPLDEIDFADDHLMFYEENQCVVAWGIARSRLSEPDPPVDQGQPPTSEEGVWDFSPEFPSISEFFLAQAAWQAVSGGLSFCGCGQFAHFETVAGKLGTPVLERAGMRAWLIDEGVVVDVGDGMVSLGAHDANGFETASAQLGIDINDWDYATLTDE